MVRKLSFRSRLKVEGLECRLAPATIQQIGGNLYISNQSNALLVQTTATPGQIEIFDGALMVTVGNVTGTIAITGTNVSDSVQFKANAGAFSGNLSFNMGNANDTVVLQATAPGGIGGNVTVLPGLGSDTTAISAATRIGGSLSLMDPGGINAFLALAPLTVDGNMSIAGVTAFVNNSTLNVGGNLTVSSTPGASNLGVTFTGTISVGGNLNVNSTANSTGISAPTSLTVAGNMNLRLGKANSVALGGTTTVGGNVSYFGGLDTDSVTIASTVIVAGSANFQMSNGTNSISVAPAAQLNGNVSVTGGSGSDIVTLLGTITGNLAVNPGHGSNGTIIGGLVVGSIQYRGGNGSEALTLAPALPTFVNADVTFGTGTATLSLISNVTLTGRVRGTGGAYTFVQGGATLGPTLVFENFP